MKKKPAKKAVKKTAKKVATYNKPSVEQDMHGHDPCAKTAPEIDQRSYQLGIERGSEIGYDKGERETKERNKYSRLNELVNIRDGLNAQLTQLQYRYNIVEAEIKGLKTEIAAMLEVI